MLLNEENKKWMELIKQETELKNDPTVQAYFKNQLEMVKMFGQHVDESTQIPIERKEDLKVENTMLMALEFVMDMASVADTEYNSKLNADYDTIMDWTGGADLRSNMQWYCYAVDLNKE